MPPLSFPPPTPFPPLTLPSSDPSQVALEAIRLFGGILQSSMTVGCFALVVGGVGTCYSLFDISCRQLPSIFKGLKCLKKEEAQPEMIWNAVFGIFADLANLCSSTAWILNGLRQFKLIHSSLLSWVPTLLASSALFAMGGVMWELFGERATTHLEAEIKAFQLEYSLVKEEKKRKKMILHTLKQFEEKDAFWFMRRGLTRRYKSLMSYLRKSIINGKCLSSKEITEITKSASKNKKSDSFKSKYKSEKNIFKSKTITPIEAAALFLGLTETEEKVLYKNAPCRRVNRRKVAHRINYVSYFIYFLVVIFSLGGNFYKASFLPLSMILRTLSGAVLTYLLTFKYFHFFSDKKPVSLATYIEHMIGQTNYDASVPDTEFSAV